MAARPVVGDRTGYGRLPSTPSIASKRKTIPYWKVFPLVLALLRLNRSKRLATTNHGGNTGERDTERRPSASAWPRGPSRPPPSAPPSNGSTSRSTGRCPPRSCQAVLPSMDATAALLASLATFGVGLGARPLGAIICGPPRRQVWPPQPDAGDRHGHGPVLGADRPAANLRQHRRDRAGAAGRSAHRPRLRPRRGVDRAQLMALEHADPDSAASIGLLGICSRSADPGQRGALPPATALLRRRPSRPGVGACRSS